MIFWLITFLIIYAIISYKRLDLAVYFIIICLPSYLLWFHVFGIPMTVLEAMILIAFFVFAIKNFYMILAQVISKKKIDYPFKWQLILILIISASAVFVSSNPMAALGVWKAYFLEAIIFFIVFVNTIKTNEQIKKIFWSLGICGLYVSVIGIFQWITNYGIPDIYWIEVEKRITSVFEYPNSVGLLLAPICVLFIGLFTIEEKISKRIIYALLAALFLITVILAKSEGAIAAISVGTVLIGLFIKKYRRLAFYFLILCLLVFLLLPNVQNEVVKQVFLQTESGQERLGLWKGTYELLKDNFFLGTGLSGFQEDFKPYKPAIQKYEYMYPHNFVLNFWVELGLAGMIVFLWLIVSYFIKCFKLIKTEYNLSIVLIAVMIALLVHGLVDVPYLKNDLAVLWWVFFGVAGVLDVNAKLKRLRLKNGKNN